MISYDWWSVDICYVIFPMFRPYSWLSNSWVQSTDRPLPLSCLGDSVQCVTSELIAIGPSDDASRVCPFRSRRPRALCIYRFTAGVSLSTFDCNQSTVYFDVRCLVQCVVCDSLQASSFLPSSVRFRVAWWPTERSPNHSSAYQHLTISQSGSQRVSDGSVTRCVAKRLPRRTHCIIM